MKIGNVSGSYGVYNSKPAISRKKTTGSSSTDTYDVSNEGKDFQIVYKSVMQSQDIREDKINAISKQIEEGTYNVSSEELADKILSRFM
jgi:negative regulator of flagellin synthesis FlgM